MKKPLTFLLSLTFLFLFSGLVSAQEPEVKREYWDNGKVKSEFRYKNGKKNSVFTERSITKKSKYQYLWGDVGEDGFYTEWYETGGKSVEQHHKDGKLDGVHISWYESGEKNYEEHWKYGKKNGVHTSWFKNGGKRIEEHYKEGKLDGFATVWYKNGKKKFETSYKKGKPNSIWTEWSEDGKKIYEKYFIDWNEE